MDYFDAAAVGPKVIAAWVLIVALGWYTFDQTKRWFFAGVLTLALLFGAARIGGVITEHHVNKMKADATSPIDTAAQRAKAIGDQKHKTSAGQAGGTSKHYEKHIEGKHGDDFERDY